MSGAAVFGTMLAQGGETLYNLWNRNEMMNREDSAVQRRVRDMKMAGINPILAAGQPAESKQGHSASIDSNMAQDLLVGQQIKNLKEQGIGLELANKNTAQQNKDMLQEYKERARNIKFYVDHNMPSDNPNQTVSGAAQIISALKDGTKGTALGATIDQAKSLGGKVVDTVKKPIDSYNLWVLTKAPEALAKVLIGPMSKKDLEHLIKSYNVDPKRAAKLLEGRK